MKLVNFLKTNALVFIMVFYLIIASSGIFFNYSLFNTTGDEAPLLSATLKMIADGSFRPNYPSFYHLGLGAYLYLPFFLVFLIGLRLSGLFPSFEAIKLFGQIEFARFLPLARFISVLTGLACLYLLYKICQKLFNDKLISLLAVFFLAFSLLFVQISHFARIWLPQILTILLAFYFIIGLYQADKAKLKHYLFCGLGVGLAFGAHVVGIFIYFSFLAAHYFKNRNKKILKIIFNNYFWLANFLFLIIYFIVYYLNTYGFIHYLGGIFLNPNKMLNLSETFTPLVERASRPGPPGTATITKSVSYYFTAFWQAEPWLLVLGLAGSVLMLIKRRALFIIIYSFILFYLLAIFSISIKVARYLLPILPFFAISAAYFLAWLYERIKHKKIFGGAAAVLCLLYLYPALLWDYKFLLPASRLEAAGWVYNNLSPGESIINLDGHFELNENRQSLRDLEKYSPEMLTKKRAFLLSSGDEVFPKPNYYIFFYPHYKEAPPEIINKKFNYLIISWLDKKNYDYWLSKLKYFNLTPEDLSLVKRFPAEATFDDLGADLGDDLDRPLINLWKLKQNGPIVDIYEIK